jgi:flagellar biosynthesis protein FlhA
MADNAIGQQGIGFGRLGKSSEMAAIGLFLVVALLIFIPLPAFVLDLFLVLNITFALVILLVTLYAKEPLEFSIFPSLLLMTTLLRLGLNVSASRLILTAGNTGSHAAGRVIEAFGTFVGGNEPVVGFIIFLILVIIQFVVITNGAQRVSEVAARFTLDAMPGKQMAIDADLNAGLITEDDARNRRRHIQREADFYGAMDGSSKFVRGDAIAAIIIVAVNILGGIVMGMFKGGLSIGQVFERYTILTIGDGLVTQIPALIIATATGLIVTRTASENNMGADFAKQILAQPKALAVSAGVLGVMGIFFPGWSRVPLLIMAVLVGTLAYYLFLTAKNSETASKLEASLKPASREPENVGKLLSLDPMELEIGFGLIPFVEEAQGGDLLDRITMIRRQTAMDMGLVVPPIRIRDNMQLPQEGYCFKIRGTEVARAELMAGRYLAINATGSRESLPGIATREPTFSLPAVWIEERFKSDAEQKGFTVVDLPSIIATHLTEIIRTHAGDLLTRQDVQKLIDNIKQVNSTVVEELVPAMLGVGDVQKVLQNLLREKVPIRDMVTILETLADHARGTKDTETLTEFVRQALYRTITKTNLSPDNAIHAITLDPLLEQSMVESVQRSDRGTFLALDPRILQPMFASLSKEIENMSRQGYQPLVLCSPAVRKHFKKLVEKLLPNLIVLSYNELDPKTEIQPAGTVSANNANQAV